MFAYQKIDPNLISNRVICKLDDTYHKVYDSVILSCYMTSKKDPQRHVYQPNDCFDYIKGFYESILKCDLHAVIFYDNLSDDFVLQYQTDKIIFKKCTMGEYSINDERYIIYYQYLLSNHYKYVLMSDVSDVFVNANPFELLKNDNRLFVGTNNIGEGVSIMNPKWFERRNWKLCPFNEKLKNANYDMIGYQENEIQIYNAGLIGSSYSKIMWVLTQMIGIMLIIKSRKNYNMIILNYIINRYLLEGYDIKTFCSQHLYTGYPFNSLYLQYESIENSKCCLFHK